MTIFITGAGPAWDPETCDAELDPWCVVQVEPDVHHLFGFALRHDRTGGLAWMRSSPLVWVDPSAGRALTASGRRYALGYRVSPGGLGDLEARLAFMLQFKAKPLGPDWPDLTLQARPLAGNWLSACQIARQLHLPPPDLKARDVKDFQARHAEEYQRHQARSSVQPDARRAAPKSDEERRQDTEHGLGVPIPPDGVAAPFTAHLRMDYPVYVDRQMHEYCHRSGRTKAGLVLQALHQFVDEHGEYVFYVRAQDRVPDRRRKQPRP